jgi:hypothetical protein
MTKRSRLNALIAIGVLIAAAVGLMVWVGPGILNRWIDTAWSEPPRTYRVTEDMPFLTDDIALRFATRLMSDEGKRDDWQPREDRRTTSPEGRPDVYLARNSINPNRGYVCFGRAGGDGQLMVQMEYDADARTIECQLWYPK